MVRSLVCCLFFPALFAAQRDPLSYVNPLIGTKKSKIGYGGTMPFVSPPFAMTNWTPQTRQNKISVTSYEYDDAAITGFIGTYQRFVQPLCRPEPRHLVRVGRPVRHGVDQRRDE